MDGREQLQKAVAMAITAGYQLDREAFEFLSMAATGEDLTSIMNRALKKLSDLTEKPHFINRTFLENLLSENAPKEIATSPSTQPAKETTEALHMLGPKTAFRPLAKDIDSNLVVIADPSTKLNTNGTMEDYLSYFRDRFRRIDRLLRQRIDVRTAALIADALRAQPGSKVKIIGIITEKRESKQRTILTVEDLQTGATVLVPQNVPEEVKRKVRSLMLDQIVCLSVMKTSGTLLIAEDVIYPDVAQRTPHKAQEPAYAVLTSDLHVGSTKFNREAFDRFVLWLNGKYGNEQMRDAAGHVKYVLIAGDIVDGVGIYPNQVKELSFTDIYKQYRYAAKHIEQIPDYIDVVLIPGNHDASRKAAPQPALPREYVEMLVESRNVNSLGNPCSVSLHGVEVLMDHGRSLDDIVATVPGMEYKHPEKAMKLLLQSRHLAPLYGGKTMLSPEKSDFLVIERVPDIFHAGHVHVLGHTSYRGVLIVNSGAWQEQTDYMRRMGLTPTVGQVPVVNLQTLEPTTVSFA